MRNAMPGMSKEEEIQTALEAKGLPAHAITYALNLLEKRGSSVKHQLPWCEERARSYAETNVNCEDCDGGWVEVEEFREQRTFVGKKYDPKKQSEDDYVIEQVPVVSRMRCRNCA